MSWWRKYPAFVATLLGLGLVLAIEVTFLARYERATRAMRKELDRYGREKRALAALQAVGDPGNGALINAEFMVKL